MDDLLARSPLGVVVHDEAGNIVQVNAAFAQLLGYTVDEVLSLNASAIIHPVDAQARIALVAKLASGELDSAVVDRQLLNKDGATVRVRLYKSAVNVGGRLLVMVCIQDVAEQYRQLEQLRHTANHDDLTGALTRAGLREEFTRITAGPVGAHGVVAVVDVDLLKAINDQYGHAAGDAVLRGVAQRLSTMRRDGAYPADLVARHGGDEFVVVRVGATHGLQSAVSGAMHGGVELADGTIVSMSAACGEAPFGPDDELQEIIVRADLAMYQNKRPTP